MRAFLSGINNFWVGLVFGLSLPLLLIVLTLSVTLYQLTDFANDVAITLCISAESRLWRGSTNCW